MLALALLVHVSLLWIFTRCTTRPANATEVSESEKDTLPVIGFGKQDEAPVQIGIEVFDPKVSAAKAENNAALEAVLAALKE